MLPLLHKRGYLSLFGPPSLRLNLRHFTYGMGGAIAVMAVAGFAVTGLEQLFWTGAPRIELVRPPLLSWLIWLPVFIRWC